MERTAIDPAIQLISGGALVAPSVLAADPMGPNMVIMDSSVAHFGNQYGGGLGRRGPTRHRRSNRRAGRARASAPAAAPPLPPPPPIRRPRQLPCPRHPRRSGARRGTRLRRLLRRLGCGDIGTVYLSELRGGGAGNSGVGRPCWFPMKVMDKAALESRRKLSCAQTEREILQLHPSH